MSNLSSVADVIEALGGVQAIASDFEISENAVWNWRAANRLPAHTFQTIQQSLISRGLTADISLWSFGRKKSARRNITEAAE